MKLTINPRYKELLGKFYGNAELRELLDLVALERRRKEMIYYAEHNRYPEEVDGLDMLQMDFATMDKFYKNSAK